MKYLISGIGPGKSGVGRLMTALIPEYTKRGYKVIYKRDEKSIRKLLNEKKYFLGIIEYAVRLFAQLYFSLKIKTIINSDIIFIHPQTAGFDKLLKLLKRNSINFYLMDNSFFCIKSYNMNPESHEECLHCLGNIDPLELCNPFPVKINKFENILFLKELKKNSNQITFFTQNKLQSELVKKHFGDFSKINIIGMDTKELSFELDSKVNGYSSTGYDVVFHGAPILEKGILYVIELAKLLPFYTFLIPSNEVSVMYVFNHKLPDNISCKDLTWESGLKEEIIGAKLVINPSLWSSCIEGALLKSAKFNDNVATVESKYGYENEISTIKNHLRLNRNPLLAAIEIKLFLEKIKNK
jgi:hypothetical protein